MKWLAVLLLAPSFSYSQNQTNVQSTLETVNIASGDRKVVYQENIHFEAPNWSRDGKYFVLNSLGKLYTLTREGKNKTLVNTGTAKTCNNDHGISFDGKWLAISSNNETDTTKSAIGRSSVFVLPITGGEPRQVTKFMPSYWHGWSPDGQVLAYCASRNGNYDVYTIPVGGGDEKRLTTSEGLDDGPEYSPDGKYIYFNSMRTGRMQIWRMKPDGTDPEQLTNDSFANWFAHPSPDGKWIVFITYLEDQGSAHPFGKDVKLRLMNLQDRTIRDLTNVFFGGQGSINVPSWSPDSKQVAFVTYKKLN